MITTKTTPKKMLTTKSFTGYLDTDGILKCKCVPEVFTNLEQGKENADQVRVFNGSEKFPILFDISKTKGLSPKCRAYYANEAGEYFTAAALLTNSPLAKLVGGFFVNFNKPTIPVKLFTDPEKALAWLQQFT